MVCLTNCLERLALSPQKYNVIWKAAHCEYRACITKSCIYTLDTSRLREAHLKVKQSADAKEIKATVMNYSGR